MSTAIPRPVRARGARGRGIRIIAGAAAAVEAALGLVLYVVVAALLAPTVADQLPLAIGFGIAVIALGWTAALAWRESARRAVSVLVVIVAWAANLFGLVYLVGTFQAVALLALPLAALAALVVAGTLPIVSGATRAAR